MTNVIVNVRLLQTQSDNVCWPRTRLLRFMFCIVDVVYVMFIHESEPTCMVHKGFVEIYFHSS